VRQIIGRMKESKQRTPRWSNVRRVFRIYSYCLLISLGEDVDSHDTVRQRGFLTDAFSSRSDTQRTHVLDR
jgi:hypothetical protein